ncbi:MAG TPA: hypothetical protein PLJ78_05135 [Anaerolineae bacterium]|nr:hypothetical protein [Anaerolineae bacterium]HQK13314.1 hypothetical protein [Anaerolineae bacterium]
MEKGKYFLINNHARIYLDVIASISGRLGFEKVLQHAGLNAWLEALPPYNEASEVDFADFSALNAMTSEVYGPRAGQAMAQRAGRALFTALTPHFSETLDIDNPTFKAQPPAQRVKAILEVLVHDNSSGDMHGTFQVAGEQFIYIVNPCPFCWGQTHAPEAICSGVVGFLQQAVEWIGAGDHYRVEEAACAAAKASPDASCVFVFLKLD